MEPRTGLPWRRGAAQTRRLGGAARTKGGVNTRKAVEYNIAVELAGAHARGRVFHLLLRLVIVLRVGHVERAAAREVAACVGAVVCGVRRGGAAGVREDASSLRSSIFQQNHWKMRHLSIDQ